MTTPARGHFASREYSHCSRTVTRCGPIAKYLVEAGRLRAFHRWDWFFRAFRSQRTMVRGSIIFVWTTSAIVSPLSVISLAYVVLTSDNRMSFNSCPSRSIVSSGRSLVDLSLYGLPKLDRSAMTPQQRRPKHKLKCKSARRDKLERRTYPVNFRANSFSRFHGGTNLLSSATMFH